MNTLDRYNDAVFAWQYEYGEQGSNDGDIEFYIKKLKSKKHKVLELGCGTGRITIPLKKAGINIVGLDNAKEMIKIARKKAVKAKLKIPFIIGDALNFKSHSKFSTIIFPYNSISQFNEKEIPKLIQNIKLHLEPKGKFFFDINRNIRISKLHPLTKIIDWTDPLCIKELGVIIRRKSSITRRPEKRVLDIKYFWEITHKNRRIEKRKTSMQFSIQTPDWYIEQFKKNGFNLINHIVNEHEGNKMIRQHSFIELQLN
ncbi:class I SAM-dependent methyltransferase [Patescibacteria group bacterium]|nr:class I SAM-dependent methyltransferase [Patescibacteria group bacterium]